MKMMRKENFVKILNAARDYWDKVGVLSDVLDVDMEDNFLITFVSDVIDAVGADMESDCPSEWEWLVNDFAWAFNFGRDGDFLVVVNDEEKVITTAGELYDALVEIAKG